MKLNNTITTHELAEITGKQHWEVLRGARTAIRNLKLAQDDYLVGTAEDGEMFPYYALPKHIAMRVAEKCTKQQKQDIETHFAVAAIEKIVEKAPRAITLPKAQPVIVKAPTEVPLMTSLEMVGYINDMRKSGEKQVRHDDFMRKVPKVLGTEGLRNFSDTYIHPQNKRVYPCYKFPKREACLMAMSYSYDLQAKVYDRMTQLENELNGFVQPQTKKDWIRLSLEQEEKIEQLSLQVKEAQPAVEFHHAVTEAVNVHDFEEAAKVLHIGRNTLTQILRDERILTKKNLPYQRYINDGYFTVVEHPTRSEDGQSFLNAKTMITGKGLQFIQKKV